MLKRFMRNRLLAVLRGERNHDRLAGVLEELLPEYVERETDFDRLRGLAGMILPRFAAGDPDKRRLASPHDVSLRPPAEDPERAPQRTPVLADLNAVTFEDLLSGYGENPANNERIGTLVRQLLPVYAKRFENMDDVALLLEQILPQYAYWQWGEDTVLRRHFRRWQRAGFNLVPNHHYFPIPDVEFIEPRLDRVSALRGIDLREKEQLVLLESVFAQYREELEAFSEQPTGRISDFFLDNHTFRHVDAHALHCMVRHNKPRRVIEVGSGYSTLVTAAACVRNQELDGVESTFVAIEPFPNDLFREEVPGLTRLVEERLESVGCEIFEELDDGDILFIDSTHVLATGSDVAQLYLEILPALKPGVLVHIHDIFLPDEYPKNWITEEHIFWNEQYLLQAFLAFNDSFEVVFAASFLHREHPDALVAAVPGFSPELHMPGSFWIRRTR